jgi:hypothetical protein
MNFVRGALVSVAVLITTTALPALAFRLRVTGGHARHPAGGDGRPADV